MFQHQSLDHVRDGEERGCANTWKKPVSSSRQIVVPEKVGCLSDNLENLILQEYEEIGGLMFDAGDGTCGKDDGKMGLDGRGGAW